MAKTFEFPVWLKGSPEEQAAEGQRQALLRASFTRAHMTDAERLIGRGALLESTARGNLEQSAGKDKEARILAESQLADAVAMQGRFSEAVEIHPNAVRRAYFRKIGAAIEKPDDQKCNCPDDKTTISGVECEVTPRFELCEVFSPVHGQIVSVVACSKCPHTNARPLRSRLLPMKAALSANEAARQAIKGDAQVLAAKGPAR